MHNKPILFFQPVFALFLTTLMVSALAAPVPPSAQRLPGHVPHAAVAAARLLGRVAPNETVGLALALPLRNQAALDVLLRRQYTPGDALYGHYLSPEEFTQQFGPTAADYQKVTDYAKQQGLTVIGTHPNRILLDVSGPASAVETAFGLHLQQYRSTSGRVFRAPDADPLAPASLAGRLSGVIGLDTATVRHSHLRPAPDYAPALRERDGSGPYGGLTPTDTKTAYSLQNTGLTGAGQTVAVFQLDGFTTSDITAYQSAYGLSAVSVQTILVDGASGTAGSDSDEVTLDIEMAMSLAPSLSKVLVYETPNTQDQQYIDCFNKIATDDLAKQVSTSWGGAEDQTDQSLLNSENTIFQQMAAQGQSMFAASGDYGAYDDGTTLSVDDPGSQPYVTDVGGTTLTSGSGASYESETVWSDPTSTSSMNPNGSGAGGGYSAIWPTPSYQQSLNPVPSTRSVPDVSLDADPNTGFSVYYQGAWTVYGGTSAAAPLWASFTALVNQNRVANGKATIGLLNPSLYQIGASGSYASAFHDITTGNNLYYSAEVGYDVASGWGTLIGSGLIPLLVNGLSAKPTHILWTNTNGTASLWNYTPASGAYTSQNYGPYAGWSAKAVADGGTDGLIRLLWNNTNGTASLWRITTPTSFTTNNFGPYSGWTANALSVGAGNTTHLLWTNTNGTAALWNVSGGSYQGEHDFGPYAGWTAKAVADAPDGSTRLLWTNTNGTAAYWSINSSTGNFTQFSFGPYAGWSAKAISVSSNTASSNTTHILWSNTNGTQAVWNYSPASGSFTQNTYGPYSGWSANAIADGSDGNVRLLWDNTNGTASFWSLDNTTGVFGAFSFGPYSGWTATAISAQ